MTPPIKYWSHSSLMAFLRNPLAWHKRYVERVFDSPSSPAGVVGRAGHIALQHFYSGIERNGAVDLGLEYLRGVSDFEINFGRHKTRAARKKKRVQMEREYLQAVSFYLERPPKHQVLGVEVSGMARVPGLSLPVKAISDLVVESKGNPGAIDIVDHKFVDHFSAGKAHKTLFVVQAIFNYYTVSELFKRPVKRFIIYECRKRKNFDGSGQMHKYVIEFEKSGSDFELFHRLLKDATAEISRKRIYLPNPSDMFEGENSFDIYRLGLVE